MLNKTISVVFPAYNEAENIRDLIQSAFNFLKSNFSDFEIVVVDDGSKDDTYALCSQAKGPRGEHLRIIRHQKNQGYGAALRSGLFSAEKDFIFYTDADQQFDLSQVLKFFRDIDNYDLIIGYRINRQDTKLRKLVAFCYNRLIRIIFGLKVKDIDCSFKLFRRETLKALSIERDDFFVDTELLLKAKQKGFKLKEVGVKHLARKAGQSTVKFSHIFTTLSDIIYFLKKLKVNGYEAN